MLKKRGFRVLLLVLVLQFLVPVGMIAYQSALRAAAAEKGTVYTFPLQGCYCMGGKVRFSVQQRETPASMVDGRYAVITEDDGIAYFTLMQKKPTQDNYIRSSNKRHFFFPVSEFPYEGELPGEYWELLYPDGDKQGVFAWLWDAEEDEKYEGYLRAKVYKGLVLPQELVIDGEPLEDFIQNRLPAEWFVNNN